MTRISEEGTNSSRKAKFSEVRGKKRTRAERGSGSKTRAHKTSGREEGYMHRTLRKEMRVESETTSLNVIPTRVLAYIMSFLKGADAINAGLSSKRLSYAFLANKNRAVDIDLNIPEEVEARLQFAEENDLSINRLNGKIEDISNFAKNNPERARDIKCLIIDKIEEGEMDRGGSSNTDFNTELAYIAKNFENLETLTIKSQKIMDISVVGMKNLKKLRIDQPIYDIKLLNAFPNLEELNIQISSLGDISWPEAMPSIKKIQVRNREAIELPEYLESNVDVEFKNQ